MCDFHDLARSFNKLTLWWQHKKENPHSAFLSKKTRKCLRVYLFFVFCFLFSSSVPSVPSPLSLFCVLKMEDYCTYIRDTLRELYKLALDDSQSPPVGLFTHSFKKKFFWPRKKKKGSLFNLETHRPRNGRLRLTSQKALQSSIATCHPNLAWQGPLSPGLMSLSKRSLFFSFDLFVTILERFPSFLPSFLAAVSRRWRSSLLETLKWSKFGMRVLGRLSLTRCLDQVCVFVWLSGHNMSCSLPFPMLIYRC